MFIFGLIGAYILTALVILVIVLMARATPISSLKRNWYQILWKYENQDPGLLCQPLDLSLPDHLAVQMREERLSLHASRMKAFIEESMIEPDEEGYYGCKYTADKDFIFRRPEETSRFHKGRIKFSSDTLIVLKGSRWGNSAPIPLNLKEYYLQL